MTTEPEFQKFITRSDQSEHAWEVAQVGAVGSAELLFRPVESGEKDGKDLAEESGQKAETPPSLAPTQVADWTPLGNGRYLIRVDGRPIVAHVVRTSAGEYWIESGGRQASFKAEDEISARAARQQRAANSGKTGPVTIPAPMPGTVLQILVADGDHVEEGQPILIIEAMKMQNELTSPAAGTVHGISVEPGQAVEARQKLCEVIR